LLACPAQQGGPPPGNAPGSDPSQPWTAGGGPGGGGVAYDDTPVESGFTHCCGSARYRMEIECGEMLKRCYEYSGGGWHQTYGRHCKEQLGEACYLEDCDAKCQ
jgi:hypothetical protein